MSKPKNRRAIYLSQILKQHGEAIARLTWSPSGKYLSCGARRGVATIWRVSDNTEIFQVKVGSYHAYNLCWSADEKYFAISSDSPEVQIYDFSTLRVVRILKIIDLANTARRRRETVMGLGWAPQGYQLASGSHDGIRIWNGDTGELLATLVDQSGVNGVAWSPNGAYLASTSYSNTVCVWDSEARELVHRFPSGYHPAISWSPDSRLIAFALDSAIIIRDGETGRTLNVLEAHSQEVRSVAFSADGGFLASRGSKGDDEDDRQVLIWRTDEWKITKVLKTPNARYIFGGLAFSPTVPLLAISSQTDRIVKIWGYDPLLLRGQSAQTSVVYYKNAKVALVGNSGVGKSGLSLVINNRPFVATDSTHGRFVYELGREEHVEEQYRTEIRETVLWDLAGQPGYRLIHQLHLDDVDVGLIVFDSKDEADPLAGIRHWNRALDHSHQTSGGENSPKLNKILVAARTDRGPIGVSRDRIEVILKDLSISHYCETSAKDGMGIEELRGTIIKSIDWKSIPTVSSNLLLQRLRSYIATEVGRGCVLLSLEDLSRGFMQHSRTKARINFRSYLQRLQRLGTLRQFSFGNLILLKPELLDSYAAAIVFAAKQEPDGMGSIPMRRLISSYLPIPKEDKLLSPEQQHLLLMATTEDLIRHELALKEDSEAGEILIFPSQLTRENPELPDPAGKELKLQFSGPVMNIYASLVVRLAHSESFRVAGMWKNATQFSPAAGGECGIFLTERGDGEGLFTLFYSPETPEAIKQQFENYVISHLRRKSSVGSVLTTRFLLCLDPSCRTPISDIAISKRRERGFTSIDCNVCGSRLSLNGDPTIPDPSQVTDDNVRIDRQADVVKRREAGLVSAAGEMLSDRFQIWAGGKRATVAIVFTDLVGSTALNDAKGDEEMWELRSVHLGFAKHLVDAFGGYQIKIIGDSVMAAFRTALEALDFASAIVQNPGSDGLEVRAGIHVGPIRIDDNDAFGGMVNYAARVTSSIKGNGVRLSKQAFHDISLEKPKRYQEVVWTEISGLSLKGFGGLHSLWEYDGVVS